MKSYMPITETKILKLPVSSKTVKIRPILIREEKILLMGMETEDPTDNSILDSIFQVVKNCIIEPENINIENMYWVDFSTIFINLRKISKGESVNIKFKCGYCKNEHDEPTSHIGYFKIDDLLKIENFDKKKDKIVKISDDLGCELSYTKTKFIKKLIYGSKEVSSLLIIDMIKDHIVSILKGEERFELTDEELNEWVDQLDKKQFDKIRKWFEDEPKMTIEAKWICEKCKKENVASEVNILNFFAL